MKSRVASLAALAACLAVSAAGQSQSAQATAASCLPDCSGQTLTTPNFSHQDLTNAKFVGATIIGASFVRANLTGAKFDNARFQAVPGFPTQTPDFTFANLTSATFTGAQFLAPTYFTYATLTCADFSGTNINNGNAIFGEEPLNYDKGACRPKFIGTTMSCEFIDDWKGLDMTNAVVTACSKQLSHRDFSGAIFTGVDFTSVVLDGDLFVKANLNGATLNGASLQCTSPGVSESSGCVDLTNALMKGAQLNNANLSGASLYGAFLSNTDGSQAAKLIQAHLRNVNLAFSQLSGVDFTLANFYGNNPANPLGCKTTGGDDLSGFTLACATAHKATMTGTKFINSYLYGVDFTNAPIAGANFYQAVLAGANFASAQIGVNPSDSSGTSFSRAYLQGTNLGDKNTTISGADFTNAFFDFHTGGNLLSITLGGANHNAFAPCAGPPTVCKVPTGQDVCVFVRFPLATVPGDNTTITCPDGVEASRIGGCGTDFSPGSSHWQSKLTIGAPPQNSGIPPGWYSETGSFEPAAPLSAVCNGQGTKARVSFW